LNWRGVGAAVSESPILKTKNAVGNRITHKKRLPFSSL
jgi:hypothetical protein